MKLLSILFFILIFLSCRGTKDASQPEYQMPQPEFAEGITFVTFTVFKDPRGKVSFSHYQTIHTEGKLKEEEIKPRDQHTKYIIQLLGSEDVPLIEFPISDVLNPSMEVFSENGEIRGEQTSLDKATVFFRFTTLKNTFSKAALYEIGPDKKEKLLETIELK